MNLLRDRNWDFTPLLLMLVGFRYLSDCTSARAQQVCGAGHARSHFAHAQNTQPNSVAAERDPQEKALTELDRAANQAHKRGDVRNEIEIRKTLSSEAWINYEQHAKCLGRWNRWAIVYENDLPLARLLEGSHEWSDAEAIYRHNRSSLEHERLAGNDIKSENDLELAHLLTKEGKQPEAQTLCSHWRNKVKHNADFALFAVEHNVPTPPLYDTPEVETAVWELACGRKDDGFRMLEEQIQMHPGMLAPFTAIANYYTTEGDFPRALATERDGISALLSTPNASRKRCFGFPILTLHNPGPEGRVSGSGHSTG